MTGLEEVVVMAWVKAQAAVPNAPPSGPLRGGLSATVGAGALAMSVALAPAFVVAAAVVAWAWWMGWPASRLRNLTAGWAVCVLIGAVFVSPFTAWLLGVRRIVAGDWTGLADTYALEVLAGLLLAWAWWWTYERAQRSGHRQEAGERFERRQSAHRTRSARRRGRRVHTPLTTTATRGGTALVIGQRIEDDTRLRPGLAETLGMRHRWWVTIGVGRLAQHLAVVGITGSGKSVFLRRLALGWLEAQWSSSGTARSVGAGGRSSQGLAGSHDPRPLCIFIDAKGGETSTQDGAAWCEEFEALGIPAERTLSWPYWGRLDMWRMSGKSLVESLDALAREREDHPFYARQRRRLLQLVCLAPGQPSPTSGPDLIRRMHREWLEEAYRGNDDVLADVAELARKTGGTPALADVRMLYRERFTTLGHDFDAGMPLSDLDALYCTLPGTTRRNEAQAKARVLVELLLSELDQHRREVLFVMDEFSAVSEALALHEVMERVRSMGGRVVVSAQTWEGFGATEDERSRLLGDVATVVVFQTANPEPFSKRAGARRRLEATRRDDGEGGSARLQDQFLLPPDRVRHLDVGEAALFATGHGGSVTWFYTPPVDLPAVRAEARQLAQNPEATARPIVGERLSLLELERAMDQVAKADPASGPHSTWWPSGGDADGPEDGRPQGEGRWSW